MRSPPKRMFPLDSSSTNATDSDLEALQEVDTLVESLTGLKNRTQENNSLKLVPYEGPQGKTTPDVKTPPGFLPQKRNVQALGCRTCWNRKPLRIT